MAIIASDPATCIIIALLSAKLVWILHSTTFGWIPFHDCLLSTQCVGVFRRVFSIWLRLGRYEKAIQVSRLSNIGTTFVGQLSPRLDLTKLLSLCARKVLPLRVVPFSLFVWF